MNICVYVYVGVYFVYVLIWLYILYIIVYFSKHSSICSYYASTAFPPRLAPPLKRPRLMPPTRAQHPKLQKQQLTANTGTIPDLNQLKVYSKCSVQSNKRLYCRRTVPIKFFTSVLSVLKSNLLCLNNRALWLLVLTMRRICNFLTEQFDSSLWSDKRLNIKLTEYNTIFLFVSCFVDECN